MASNDPDFETKAADIIGLYLHPPQHAAIVCVDEKTAIQALDRLAPVLPPSPAVRSGMALKIAGMARFPCMRRWTQKPAKCRARRRRGTPAMSLSDF
jgi:hypothetical protein